jgi:hypothetical protein
LIQAYYNPYLVNILRELVVSGGTSSINTVAGEQRSCDLEMIDVPIDMHGKEYSELFESLCNQGTHPNFYLSFLHFFHLEDSTVEGGVHGFELRIHGALKLASLLIIRTKQPCACPFMVWIQRWMNQR